MGTALGAQTYVSLEPIMINGSIVTSKDTVCDNEKNSYVFTINPEAELTLQWVTASIEWDSSLISHLRAQLTLPGTAATLDFGYIPVDWNSVEILFPDTYIRRGTTTTVTLTPVIPCSSEWVYTLSLSDISTTTSGHETFIEEDNLYQVTSSLRSSPYPYYDSDIRSVFFTENDIVIKSCINPLDITDADVYPTSILRSINLWAWISVEHSIDWWEIWAGCKDIVIPYLALWAWENSSSHEFQFFLDWDSTNKSYEQYIQDNIKEVTHTVERATTNTDPAQLTWTEDVKTLWGIVGLSLCNNDKTTELPWSRPSVDIRIENKVNKTSIEKTITLPKTFAQGTCSYAYLHRRELGTINEWTYRIYIDTEEWTLKDHIITQTSEVNVTILNAEQEALEIRQDYHIKSFFLKEDEVSFSICNEWGKRIIEREPLVALFKWHHDDISTEKHSYSYSVPVTLWNGECQATGLSLKDLPDSIFIWGNKLITLAIIDEIDEYDFWNNSVTFEASKYEREWVTTPVEEEELPYNPNPTTTELIDWMHENGLTKFNTIEDFGPDRLITRGEIAKFFTQFAALLELKIVKSNDQCKFKDIEFYDSTLTPHILKACKLWLVNGFGWNYSPENNLLQAEGLTVAMRAIKWVQDETTNPWRLNYYDEAGKLNIIDASSVRDLDQNADRQTIGLWLYRTAHSATLDNNTPTFGKQ